MTKDEVLKLVDNRKDIVLISHILDGWVIYYNADINKEIYNKEKILYRSKIQLLMSLLQCRFSALEIFFSESFEVFHKQQELNKLKERLPLIDLEILINRTINEATANLALAQDNKPITKPYDLSYVINAYKPIATLVRYTRNILKNNTASFKSAYQCNDSTLEKINNYDYSLEEITNIINSLITELENNYHKLPSKYKKKQEEVFIKLREIINDKE